MLTDTPPYATVPPERELALIKKISLGGSPALLEDLVQVPHQLRDLLSRCWRAIPSERPIINDCRLVLLRICEPYVNKLEDELATHEAKSERQIAENERLRDLLHRVQNENAALKQYIEDITRPGAREPSMEPIEAMHMMTAMSEEQDW